MSRRGTESIEDRLAALGALRTASDGGTVTAGLRTGLGDRCAPVVARAARLAVELDRGDLAPELAAAFHRLLDDERARDPGCVAGTAIATALVDLDSAQVEVFRRGIRHVQWEPVYGGRVDVAAELRAQCAIGLAATAVPDLMLELADLLADREPAARSGAIRAIASAGRIEGPALLRFKARAGDPLPEVLGECFAALLAVDPEHSLEVVADALSEEDDAVFEAAALALGAARSEAAFAALRKAADELVFGGRRRILLTAIALLRLDAAIDHLVELVADAPLGVACEAVEALAVYRHDPELRRRVEDVVAARDDRRLTETVGAAFAR